MIGAKRQALRRRDGTELGHIVRGQVGRKFTQLDDPVRVAPRKTRSYRYGVRHRFGFGDKARRAAKDSCKFLTLEPIKAGVPRSLNP
jgi:hypothetical protein